MGRAAPRGLPQRAKMGLWQKKIRHSKWVCGMCKKTTLRYGEVTSENVLENVKTILSEIDEKPVLTECRRVGTQKTGAIRPVKFAVSSVDHAIRVMRNARKLRTKGGYGSVYICPDRSLEERRAYKKLVEEVKQKQTTEPDKVHIIKNNKIGKET